LGEEPEYCSGGGEEAAAVKGLEEGVGHFGGGDGALAEAPGDVQEGVEAVHVGLESVDDHLRVLDDGRDDNDDLARDLLDVPERLLFDGRQTTGDVALGRLRLGQIARLVAIDHFLVSVEHLHELLAHLRPVKDPLLPVQALAHVPPTPSRPPPPPPARRTPTRTCLRPSTCRSLTSARRTASVPRNFL
jgi:hypothetical protein